MGKHGRAGSSWGSQKKSLKPVRFLILPVVITALFACSILLLQPVITGAVDAVESLATVTDETASLTSQQEGAPNGQDAVLPGEDEAGMGGSSGQADAASSQHGAALGESAAGLASSDAVRNEEGEQVSPVANTTPTDSRDQGTDSGVGGNTVEDEGVGLAVEAHVQDLGWQPSVEDGGLAGTTGKGLQLEALRVRLVGFPEGSNIQIETHVAEIGWQAAVGQGAVAGTEGRSLAIQAIAIQLTGPAAEQYDIWYRVHVADYGWLGWAKNGERAGTTGYSKAAQALNIVVLPKGFDAPGATSDAYRSPQVSYKAHIEDLGWQTSVTDGAVAGTTGQSRGMESLSVSLGPDMPQGAIELRAHVAELGWQPWTTSTCGTTGRRLPMEAVELRLTGEAVSSYDVWYRVHVADYGWLGWAKNGDPAGTAGKSKEVQAIEIRIVPKNGDVPGGQDNAYIGDFETLSASGTLISNASASIAQHDVLSIGNVSNETPLRSLGISLVDPVRAGSISYRTRSLDSAWQERSSFDGAQTVPENSGLPITAFEASLSGDVAAVYDLWYRVSLVDAGWLGWASNGAQVGTDNDTQAINAVELALVPKGGQAPGDTANSFVSDSVNVPMISYQAHVAEIGWQNIVSDGEVAGTTGKTLAMEALRVSLGGASEGDGIRVSAHVAEVGWQDFAQSPGFAGSVGQSHAMQAIKVELVGDIASTYDVAYRVHVAGYGWLGWAKNGEVAGTTGLSRDAEAVEIRLVRKGGALPESTVPAALALPELSFNVHVQDLGWLEPTANGGVNGTMGRSLRVEGLTASADSPLEGGISYSAHVEDVGWQAFASQGALAGTEGESKRIEAVKIELTGELETYFDVWYRAYVQDYGWLGWAKNGQAAGTGTISYRMEALQILITAKGDPAPGSTYRAYTEEPAMSVAQRDMISRAQGYASATSWMLMVDTTNCYVGIFTGGRGHWSQWGYWLCSVGALSSPTPRGEYTVQAKGYSFGHGYTCYYYTQFWGDYLFHTIKYNQGTFVVQDGRLGMHISEGCVRLPLEQAKWIYDNIPTGTKVVIY